MTHTAMKSKAYSPEAPCSLLFMFLKIFTEFYKVGAQTFLEPGTVWGHLSPFPLLFLWYLFILPSASPRAHPQLCFWALSPSGPLSTCLVTVLKVLDPRAVRTLQNSSPGGSNPETLEYQWIKSSSLGPPGAPPLGTQDLPMNQN